MHVVGISHKLQQEFETVIHTVYMRLCELHVMTYIATSIYKLDWYCNVLHSFAAVVTIEVGDDDDDNRFFIGGIDVESRFRRLYGTNNRTGPV